MTNLSHNHTENYHVVKIEREVKLFSMFIRPHPFADVYSWCKKNCKKDWYKEHHSNKEINVDDDTNWTGVAVMIFYFEDEKDFENFKSEYENR
ncbi:hypothetical protein LCGC14_1445650 [marine sediment metagenome]|uniref:Uncharacterized protein n=1 Tax=marine sediment metagenome TaxID=412755 RepID=A0A0F9JJA6_9ZZZZ